MKRHMKQARNIIITSALLASFALLYAHGGFEHVQGTVVKVDNDVLTVKTAKANATVKLNAKTEITRDGHRAQAADLKEGVLTVVIPKAGDREARRIVVGSADAGSHEE